MTTTTSYRFTALAEQIRDEITPIVSAIAALTGPNRTLETSVDATNLLLWSCELLGDNGTLAAQTAADLMRVRWPDGTEPPTDWWATPLGQAVVATDGRIASDVVSYAVAGAMLGGLSRQYVLKLVRKGHLVQGPGGRGVTLTSIRAQVRNRAAQA